MRSTARGLKAASRAALPNHQAAALRVNRPEHSDRHFGTRPSLDGVRAVVGAGSWRKISVARVAGRLDRLCVGRHPLILDAACGTGKYWPVLLGSGRRVVGIDFSARMLERARRKHPDVKVRRCRLQDLDETAAYHAVICVDAMENVFPEDGPKVLANFARALMRPGWLYLTVERAEDGGYTADDLRRAVVEGRERGAALVYGEVLEDGGYHFYSELPEVRRWLSEAGFALREETVGDGYRHITAEIAAWS